VLANRRLDIPEGMNRLAVNIKEAIAAPNVGQA
jgi:hypothetical protein